MATLTVTVVRPVAVIEQITGPAGEALTAGQWARLNTSTGKIELGKATTLAEAADGGIALSAAAVGDTVTLVTAGIVDLGNALGDLAYGATVFLSDTDGTLADATGTQTKKVGTVVPAWGSTTADKLLRVAQDTAFTPA